MTDNLKSHADYDYKKTEEYLFHRKVMDRIASMSKEEKLQTLIDAGILNRDGELTKRYGGTGENPGER